MTAHRATFLLIAAASAISLAAPAQAQVADGVVINIMRECAKIDDPTARLACYDNNIRQAGGNPRSSIPGQMGVPQGSGAPVASSSSPAGFGADDVRTADRFRAPPNQLEEINPRVSSIRERGQGIFVFTLEDGAQWQFAESVPISYRIPRAGETVRIERGALGSYLMYYERQTAVPVRRVR